MFMWGNMMRCKKSRNVEKWKCYNKLYLYCHPEWNEGTLKICNFIILCKRDSSFHSEWQELVFMLDSFDWNLSLFLILFYEKSRCKSWICM